MKQLNKIECEKCNKCADDGVVIGCFSGVWLCGDCYINFDKKMKELSRKLILEG